MANKCITSEGKDQVLKLAFLNDQAAPFSYCALGEKNSSASVTGNSGDFQEFNDTSYKRVKIELEGEVENNTLKASCLFDDNNYNLDDGTYIGEIALCDSSEQDANTVFFAFSSVPEIKKTGQVSLKYIWIINIE